MSVQNRKSGPAEKSRYQGTPREVDAASKFEKGQAERAPSLKVTKGTDQPALKSDHPDSSTVLLLLMEALGTKDLDFLALRVFKWVDLGTFLQFGQARGQDFQSEIFFVAQAVGAALKDADFVVEAFDEAEGDFVFRPAVGGDAVPVTLDHCGELFIWLEALPAQWSFPVVEKATCPCLRLVIPKLVEGLTKDVGRVQALIGVEQKLKAFSAFTRQVPSSAATRQALLPCSVSGVACPRRGQARPRHGDYRHHH